MQFVLRGTIRHLPWAAKSFRLVEFIARCYYMYMFEMIVGSIKHALSPPRVSCVRAHRHLLLGGKIVLIGQTQSKTLA
jgi:hypothetical protein